MILSTIEVPLMQLFNFLRKHLIADLVVLLIVALGVVIYNQPEKIDGSSIVKVLNPELTGGGTGFVIKHGKKNVIVTNDHVCGVSSGGFVTVEEDSGTLSIKPILKRSFVRDLCLIEGVNAPPMQLASSANLSRFDVVKVLGHPFLKPTTPSQGYYLGNMIGNIGFNPDKDGNCPSPATKYDAGPFGLFCVLRMELSLTTVPIYPGNSGSPIVNSKGEVIGVINSSDSNDNHGNFIPLPYLKEILNEVPR